MKDGMRTADLCNGCMNNQTEEGSDVYCTFVDEWVETVTASFPRREGKNRDRLCPHRLAAALAA